jgi:hypothetical protein
VYSPVSFGEYGKTIVGMSLIPRPHGRSRISEGTRFLPIESGGANGSTSASSAGRHDSLQATRNTQFPEDAANVGLDGSQ